MNVPPNDTLEPARLFERFHTQLREIAAREADRGATINPTALVGEAYLRFASERPGVVRNESHFLARAALVMRHLLVDHARARAALKRGGDRLTIALEPDAPSASPTRTQGVATRLIDVLALDEALRRLEALDPRQAQVVSLRYFAGLSEERVAEHLGVSRRSVQIDWQHARAWLSRAMSGDAPP